MEEGKPFVRVGVLSINSFVERVQKYITKQLYETPKIAYKLKVGDLLLTRAGASGIANVVKEPIEGIMASGGSVIAHCRPEQIDDLVNPFLPVQTQQGIASLVR